VSATFTVVSDRGVRYRAEGFDHLVIRRREPNRPLGSEIAVYARHAPLLMQSCECDARLVFRDHTTTVRVPEGVVEVHDESIVLMVTGAGSAP
jgi:hypothetical protein